VCSSVSGSTQKISNPSFSLPFFKSSDDGISSSTDLDALLALIASYIASKSTGLFVDSLALYFDPPSLPIISSTPPLICDESCEM